MAQNKIPTSPQRVRVFLRGGILAEGEVHVKAGAYRQRVSDMLNLQAAPFLALTNVNYQAPGASPMHTEALLVHIPDIVAVDLFGTTSDGSPLADVETTTTLGAAMPPPPPGSSI